MSWTTLVRRTLTPRLFALTAAVAPLRPEGATLVGVVTDADGRAVIHAHVTAGTRTTLTDRDGRFTFGDVTDSALVVDIRAIGFRQWQRVVPLTDRVTQLAVRLDRLPTTLAPIAIAADVETRDAFAAQDVVVLSSRGVQAAATGSLGQTLARVPGVSNLSGGPAAANPVLRGLSQSRIRIARDGIAQESFDGSPRWFPPADLASVGGIEVVRGPASILYGSNALGGAINLLPRPLPRSETGRLAVNGLVESQYFSNNGEGYGHASVAAAQGPIGFRAGGSYRKASGFRTADVESYTVTKIRGDPLYTGRIANTNFEQQASYAQIGGAGPWGISELLADHWVGNNNFPNANGKPTGVRSDNTTLHLKTVLNIGTGRLRPTLTTQRVRIRRAATAAKTFEDAKAGDLWDQDLVNRVVTARVDLDQPRVGTLQGTVGVELQDQDARTLKSRIQPSARTRNAAVYAFEEIRRERLTLSAAVRGDLRHQRADSSALIARLPAADRPAALDRDFQVLTGSFGAVYQVLPALSLGANASTGFRAPTLLDLYTDENRPALRGWVEGNPQLRPERSVNIEGSARLTFDKVSARAAVYRNRIANYVYLVRVDRTRTVNGGAVPVFATSQALARLTGAELSASARPARPLLVEASWSAVRGRNRTTDETLPLMPADQGRGSVRYTVPARESRRRFVEPFVELGVKHVWAKHRASPTEPFGDADDNPAGFGRASTPAYSLLDAGTGVQILTGPTVWNVQLRVENLGDAAYVDFLDTQKGFTLGQGRSVTLRVGVPFAVR